MNTTTTELLCPFDLRVEPIARFLNAELVGHPVYDGLELQWFDDPRHGTGMLAFLSRRDGRRIDYYVTPDLRLDRSGYQIGGGTGAWVTTHFDVARLEVTDRGVHAEVRFTDVDGRSIEVAVDDRDAGPRRSTDLLAPVGSGVDDPTHLLLVWLHGFELLRRGGRAPRIRIDGQDVPTGALPGAALHRRHLIKAAAPLSTVIFCHNRTGTVETVDPDAPGAVVLDGDGTGIAGLQANQGGSEASVVLDPPIPRLGRLPDAVRVNGSWHITIDGAPITGGRWRAVRRGRRVALDLDVTDRWVPPRGQPLLIRVVTRVVPLFRRWPTTYRWHAEIELHDEGPATISSAWRRTTQDRGEAYRRATRSDR